MSDWRDAYLEGCRPSLVPWDAHPEEGLDERLARERLELEVARWLRRKCSGCGAEVAADGSCPLCGTALAA